jgi:hypothetical protein
MTDMIDFGLNANETLKLAGLMTTLKLKKLLPQRFNGNIALKWRKSAQRENVYKNISNETKSDANMNLKWPTPLQSDLVRAKLENKVKQKNLLKETKNEPSPITKYHEKLKLLNLSANEEHFKLPWQTFEDTRNRSFFFNMINGLVNGNHILKKKMKVSTEKCNFCECIKQTNIHLFSECDQVEKLWKLIETALKKSYNDFNIEKEHKLLGIQNLKGPLRIAFNKIIVITWQSIAHSNNFTNILTIEDIKFRLSSLHELENNASRTFKNRKLKRHKRIWTAIEKTNLLLN